MTILSQITGLFFDKFKKTSNQKVTKFININFKFSLTNKFYKFKLII